MNPSFKKNIPLSLYIHIPWCVRKCPYCDFNSHALDASPLQEALYIDQLIQEFDQQFEKIHQRSLHSIFIGGGTPSLFNAASFAHLFEHINSRSPFNKTLEITLEANPGTIEQNHFSEFRQAGITRLSIGIQSFQNDKLQSLGRIHSGEEALRVAESIEKAGFDNFNLDLMYGLPGQTIADALYDLQKACSIKPTHLSWYQLTIENNTVFYKKPPILPTEIIMHEIEHQGREFIQTEGFQQYEVSAYAQKEKQCQHNLNYWRFGDYLGIGAGAHSKITDLENGTIQRLQNIKHPKGYLDTHRSFIAKEEIINENQCLFEFMLNALRLYQAIPYELFEAHTGLSRTVLTPFLKEAKQRELLFYDDREFSLTLLGRQFLNDVTSLFLPNEK
jgi:putative oxygen-independent coproporphyrinogen III oxidase